MVEDITDNDNGYYSSEEGLGLCHDNDDVMFYCSYF